MIPLPNVFALLRERWPWSVWMQRPWLVVGKGPSFGLARQVSDDDYLVLTLNDAVREMPRVAIAHFIDLEALERCAGSLGQVRMVVMPWVPHLRHRPVPGDLGMLVRQHPVLGRLAEERRLAWYDRAGAPRQRGGYPQVEATWFSAEAAIDLLAKAGARTVRSAGIDGGTQYAGTFADLAGVSRLVNGQPHFDRQFEGIARILCRSGIDYAPLGMDTPIRVFIAASASESLPAQVLAYSIRRHASMTVQVTQIRELGLDTPVPRDPRNRPRTPFSFQRFLVPQACGYEGRAIYLDADMLVFRDIAELWRLPFGDAPVLTVADGGGERKPQCSVMVMDCSRLRWDLRELVAHLDAGRLTYEQLMDDFVPSLARASIGAEWNSMERYVPARTALLHYTDMDRQPWVQWGNPVGYLWQRALMEAVDTGAIARDAVLRAVELGQVRPSLLEQLDLRHDLGLRLSSTARARDAIFRPPFRSRGSSLNLRWNAWFKRFTPPFPAGWDGVIVSHLRDLVLQQLQRVTRRRY